ncbi:recombinase family protein [Bacillus sp. HMF5848]|uniref:recombinase family protein n=1 Tax=Bacillus sp. HMF5848 TaxID=2495421 RepID=UPI000F784566|nr:recombinase family protein [Bacillus sp. HMF5848]RSK25691.1 recombinase family protein [Bacillus sp. HMF5848]
MDITQYIDAKKLYDEFVIVYSRVSSAQQDIKKQILLAEAYVNNHNYEKESVIWLKDNDISANKLSMDERPALQELRLLLKQGLVKTIIVYSRDRLARNFYEYVALVKEFYQYNVNVIFTSTKQPPFSKKLSIEALYGIFAQAEGQSISGRRSDTNKQYPSNIFGFIKIGKKKNTKYVPDVNVEKDLKAFLHAIKSIETDESLFTFLVSYKKIFKNKKYDDLLRYLQNPFYAAHMETSYGYEKLHHVQPIITLEDFQANQSILKKLKNEIFNAITLASSHGIIIPHCNICKKEMTFRSSKLGKSSYYVCKKKHPEIRVDIDVFNNLISSHLKEILGSISIEKFKSDLLVYLWQLQKNAEQNLIIKNRELKNIHKEITDGYSAQSNAKLDKLVQASRKLKESIKEIHISIFKIEETRKGINDHIEIIKESMLMEMQEFDQYYLCNLFFSKIEVSNTSLIYHVTFGRYFDEGDYYELRA